MKLWVKNLSLGLGLAGCTAFFGACAENYIGGGAVVVDTDYYGPSYGGSIDYRRSYDRGDSHVASPPRQDWHGGSRSNAPAPARESHAAPGKSDHDHK